MSGGVGELPGRTSLSGEASDEFAERRRRIARRFGSWRSNFAAVRTLLDSESERAAALAGNYATEAEAVLDAWLDAELEAADGGMSEERVRRWRGEASEFLEEWDLAARAEVGGRDWGSEASERFEVVLGELLERAEGRVVDRLGEARSAPGSLWRRWVRKASRWLARLFRPDRDQG